MFWTLTLSKKIHNYSKIALKLNSKAMTILLKSWIYIIF